MDDLCQSAKRWDTVGIQEGNFNDLQNISAHGVTLIADLEAESRASLPAIAIHARWSNAVRARRYFESGVATIIQLGEDVFDRMFGNLRDRRTAHCKLFQSSRSMKSMLGIPWPAVLIPVGPILTIGGEHCIRLIWGQLEISKSLRYGKGLGEIIAQ